MATASDQPGPSIAAAQPELQPEAEAEVDRSIHPSGIVPQLQVRHYNDFTFPLIFSASISFRLLLHCRVGPLITP